MLYSVNGTNVFASLTIFLSAAYPLTKEPTTCSFNRRLKQYHGLTLLRWVLGNEMRIKRHCCPAGNITGSPLLIMWCALGLSKKQTKLHFQLCNLGSPRLLGSSLSFRFWHLLLFAWTIKTFFILILKNCLPSSTCGLHLSH